MISQHGEIDLITDIFPELENVKKLPIDAQTQILINGNAFQPATVIVRHDQRLLLGKMEWGVHPTFETDPKAFHTRRLSMLNARKEKVLDPASYWHSQGLVRKPMLIPVTRTFEHRHIHTWPKPVPYAIATCHQPDHEFFYIPGIYQSYQLTDKEGTRRTLSGFAMITTQANPPMAQIHNHGENKHRMPLYVPLEMAQAWVSPKRTLGDFKEILNYTIPADELNYYTVFPLTGKAERPDGKAKDEPWTWHSLPALGNDVPATKQQLFG